VDGSHDQLLMSTASVAFTRREATKRPQCESVALAEDVKLSPKNGNPPSNSMNGGDT